MGALFSTPTTEPELEAHAVAEDEALSREEYPGLILAATSLAIKAAGGGPPTARSDAPPASPPANNPASPPASPPADVSGEVADEAAAARAEPPPAKISRRPNTRGQAAPPRISVHDPGYLTANDALE